MSWNYRIVRHHKPTEWYGLHEVFDFVCDEDEGPEGITHALEAVSDMLSAIYLPPTEGA